MSNRHEIDVPVWTIVKVVLVLLSFYLVFAIRDILALFFVVVILVAAFNPIINRWEKRIGRVPAVIALFLLVLLATIAVISLIVPPIVNQISHLAGQLPVLIERYDKLQTYLPNFQRGISSLTQFSSTLTNFTSNFVSFTAGVFGGVLTLLMAVVLTGYLLVDRDAFAKFVISLFPEEQKDGIINLFSKISVKLGSWLRGEAILGLIIGVLDLIGLLIIGVPYALTLAVISALLEVVPNVGPIIAGVIATVVALIDSPIKAVFVVILYVVVQQIENTFIVPKVMEKAVGLSPVIIIFAILVGAKLLGITGAILAVPLAASISVFIQEWPTIRKSMEKE